MAVDENGNPIEEPLTEEVIEEDDSTVEEEVTQEEKEEPTKKKEENFLDPDELPKELLPHFKRMQASFTRRMQSIAGEKEKIQLYDQLLSGGPEAVKILAQKVGLYVADKEPSKDNTVSGDNSALDFIRKEIEQALEKALGPIKADTHRVKASQTERYLDENYPDWRLYDDRMADLVKKHPSMANDVDGLYELAKLDVTKAERLKQASAKRAPISTKTSTSGRSVAVPKKADSLEEAIAIAKKLHGIK